MTQELFQRLGLALAIGLMVGLERGWKSREELEGERAAGLRTYALTGLLGGVSAALAALTSPIVLAASLVAFTAAFATFRWLEAVDERDFSATGIVAAILTFLLGAYSVLGEMRVAVAAAVATTLLLALKQPLHRWVSRLSWEEIRATLTLLAMTFLLLPVLPDRAIDPWGALNPAEVWVLAIVLAAVSFVGYIAVRVLGEHRGIAAAGLAGGLASSTATTVTFARLAREQKNAAGLLAGGILLAGAVMLARILVIVVALNPDLVQRLVYPLGMAATVFAVGGAYLVTPWSRTGTQSPNLALTNPFELGTVFKIAGVIATVVLLANLVTRTAGEGGLLVLAAASGVADVDAITLSLARLGLHEVDPRTAALGIGIAAATNTVAKCVMCGVFGTARLATIVGAVSVLALIAGAITMMTVGL
jgi:uncharacterized membrane protein (DUF4010 family)